MKSNLRLSTRVKTAAVLLAGALALAAAFAGAIRPHRSPEVAFTDPSSGGLSIVPASCPSSPGGQCGGVYSVTGGCSGAIGQITMTWDFTDGGANGQNYITITDPSNVHLVYQNYPLAGNGVVTGLGSGTYAWSFTPNNGDAGTGNMSVVVPNCSNPCDSYLNGAPQNGSAYGLSGGVSNVQINKFGIKVCIGNGSGLNYFVPAATQDELQRFHDNAPNLQGVSEQDLCTILKPGATIYPGDSYYSCNASFSLTLQADGNLVVYNGKTPLWSTNTGGKTASSFIVQTDGNLVLYGPGNSVLWASNTSGSPGFLTIQDDGNLVLYSSSGSAMWASMNNNSGGKTTPPPNTGTGGGDGN